MARNVLVGNVLAQNILAGNIIHHVSMKTPKIIIIW
jgi:hypothetical protein